MEAPEDYRNIALAILAPVFTLIMRAAFVVLFIPKDDAR
jgi:hypothetical protein